MTLLISLAAAAVSTVAWYRDTPKNEWRLAMLPWMFWGASLMWLVDAVVEYIEVGAAYFTPAPVDMLNDAFLGLSVVVLALVVWVIRLLILDPKGTIRARLKADAAKAEKNN